MRTPDLDRILSAMLKTYTGISDLNFSVGHPLQVEDFGELKPVYVDPPIEALTPHQTEQVALTLMQGNRRLITIISPAAPAIAVTPSVTRRVFALTFSRRRGH